MKTINGTFGGTKMRMTKSERRRYIRHRKKMERMALRAAEKKEKVSGQFMNRVVIAMILAALIFTVVMIFVFVRTGSEPSTLIGGGNVCRITE